MPEEAPLGPEEGVSSPETIEGGGTDTSGVDNNGESDLDDVFDGDDDFDFNGDDFEEVEADPDLKTLDNLNKGYMKKVNELSSVILEMKDITNTTTIKDSIIKAKLLIEDIHQKLYAFASETHNIIQYSSDVEKINKVINLAEEQAAGQEFFQKATKIKIMDNPIIKSAIEIGAFPVGLTLLLSNQPSKRLRDEVKFGNNRLQKLQSSK